MNKQEFVEQVIIALTKSKGKDWDYWSHENIYKDMKQTVKQALEVREEEGKLI